MYNPFVPFTKKLLKDILLQGMYYFVVQRFDWPLVAPGKGFMVSAYVRKEDADIHAGMLSAREGKLLDARTDVAKLERLVATGSGYRLFLNKLKEENWNSRMLRVYKNKIISYLYSKTNFKSGDPIDIHFSLEYGRVTATISSGHKQVSVSAFELIT